MCCAVLMKQASKQASTHARNSTLHTLNHRASSVDHCSTDQVADTTVRPLKIKPYLGAGAGTKRQAWGWIWRVPRSPWTAPPAPAQRKATRREMPCSACCRPPSPLPPATSPTDPSRTSPLRAGDLRCLRYAFVVCLFHGVVGMNLLSMACCGVYGGMGCKCMHVPPVRLVHR